MSISFIRVDDRMIHGQTCTRWALEYPCDGLIAVNDKAATTPVLKAAEEAGFGDYSAFLRAFRSAYGRSPRDWK